MKIDEVVLESRGSQVDRLKDKLLAAKKAGRKLDYDAIDRMMRDIAGNGEAELERLHHNFVKKCGSIPDKWIVNQKIKDTVEEGEVIKPDFSRKFVPTVGASVQKSPYQKREDIDIPHYDVGRGAIWRDGISRPEDREAFDRFVVDGKKIVGIATSGKKITVAATPSPELATTLVDLYNRGGFTDRDIERVPLSDIKEDLERPYKDFANQSRSKSDERIGRQKINASMNEDVDLKLLSNLPTLFKIIFLEEYVTRNGRLIESNTKQDIEYFIELLNSSVKPLIGNKYIVVSLMLVSDRIMMFQPAIIGKFMGVSKDGDFKFTDSSSGESVTFPPKITSRDRSNTGTFIFDSNMEYEKFKTVLNLRWNFKLPDFDNFNVEESANKSSKKNQKYLGPTDRVKINKDGWQIPLNKRGFGA